MGLKEVIAAVVIGSSGVSPPAPVPTAQAVSVTDVAAAAGVAQTTRTFGATRLDWNRDGFEDLVLNRHNAAPARLYQNLGGGLGYTEVSPGLLALKDRHHCAAGDFNLDTWPDLYCSVGTDGGATTGSNELWVNNLGTFTNLAGPLGVADPLGRGRYVAWLNANGDQWPDLFVGNAGPRTDGQAAPSRLFLNSAGGGFSQAPSFGLNNELGAECAYPGDFNNDGRDDLLICGTNRLMFWVSNAGGTYTNKATAYGLSGYQHDAALVDLNADGQLDLVQVAPGKVTWRPGLTGGTGLGPMVTLKTTTYAIHLTAWDLEGDGDLDLYINRWSNGTSHPPDHLLTNDGAGAFTTEDLPQVGGAGDHATAVDWDQDGLEELLVTNGYGVDAGPVQLLELVP